jgi:hypothetical protein
MAAPPLSYLPDIVAFGMGLGLAWFLKWTTTDLVWSLWLCSLVLGYLTILSAIGAGAYTGIAAIRHKDFKKAHRLPAVLMGIPMGLFLLSFFSLHFCGFHAGHSVFLGHFFPVEGMPKQGFGEAFMNPPLLWALVFQHLMKPYGLFLIPAIIAERRHVFLPLIQVAAANTALKDYPVGRTKEKPGGKTHPLGEAMARPYINVVRMHLLIFFFAISHALIQVDSFPIFAVVYAVYFFPWHKIKKPKLKASARPSTGGP